MPSTPPTYDWRELEHWGIDESLLPAGSVVRFRPPSLWEQHRLTILAVVAVIAVQTVLIVLLLLQRLRRRRAEAEVMRMSARLISAHEEERRRLAGELHDDFSQRLARLAIDASQLGSHADSDAATARTMRDELIRISEDVHDLSYRLHPSIVDDLGLIAALRAECSRTARSSDIEVDVRVGDVPDQIAPDVALCLFRVAQESLRNVVRHAHASSVDVSLERIGDALRLVASDDGKGFVQETSRRSRSVEHARARSTTRRKAVGRQCAGARHERDCVRSTCGGNALSRVRVLLADDHRIVAEGLRRLLENEFELVDLVEDGAALLAAAQRHDPDVIVTDIGMPRHEWH